MRFEGKVVLVTGASRGIGRAIAIGFGKEGAKVIVNYTNSEKRAEEVVAEIKKAGSDAIAVKSDVSNEDQVKKMINLAVKRFRRLDILVNNAGIVFDVPLSDRTVEQWKKTLDVDLIGVFLCSKHAIPQMRKQKSGAIINIASTNGLDQGGSYSIDYSAAKAGVINMTRSLAHSLGAYNIRVNCVAPGWVDTDMNSKLTKGYVEKEKKQISLGRFGRPEEQANVVLFLASDEASYMTGCTVVVDGGYRY